MNKQPHPQEHGQGQQIGWETTTEQQLLTLGQLAEDKFILTSRIWILLDKLGVFSVNLVSKIFIGDLPEAVEFAQVHTIFIRQWLQLELD